MTRLLWADRVCPACGYRLRIVSNGACGVARGAREEWLKACPRVVSLGEPLACPELLRAQAERGVAPGHPLRA